MNQSFSQSSGWWSALQKPTFRPSQLKKEAENHFGEQGYQTGALFALCDDAQKETPIAS